MSKDKGFQFSILFLFIWIITSIISLVTFDQDFPKLNLSNKLLPPLSSSLNSDSIYFLGTDELGRDVLTCLIEGASNALAIGLLSVFIAAFIGILIGSISSYFGDKELKVNIIEIIIKTISLTIYFLFVIFIIPWTQIEFVSIWFHLLLPFTVVFLVFYLAKKIGQKGILNKQLTLPVDLIIGRIIEIFESLPTLFILVALSTLISGSWLSISLIIGFTTWPNIAKFTRSEFLKIKQTTFIEASQALGLDKKTIILKHFLPNAISPIIVTLAFGVASAVIIESTLAFLGLGLNAESASWGNILASARLNMDAWWLTLFPSIAIYFVIYSCSTIGEKLKI